MTADAEGAGTSSSSRQRKAWPYVLAGVLAAYAVGLVVAGGADALEAVRQASPWALLGALACQAGVVLVWPLVHRASLRSVGADLPYRQVLPVSMVVFAVSRTAPVGGAVGAAVGVERFSRAGVSGPAATGAAFLTGPFSVLTVVLLAVLGVAVEVLAGGLEASHLVAVVGALLVLGGVIAGIVAALRTPRIGVWVIGRLGRLHRRLRKRADGWERSWERVTEDPPSPLGVLRIVGWSLVMWSISLASLGLVFLAFGRTPELTLLLVGFGIAHLASIVPTTPGAVGVAEGGMVFAFSLLGVPVGLGTTVAITYRVLETWLPTVAGIVVLVRSNGGDAASSAEASRGT
ncbi:flippase-like domain-containing protein [Nitriliruptoraceae bacterium ZYF776]|nr:flippase-like domain-containing protein [Profundirhabdus halotolerans]